MRSEVRGEKRIAEVRGQIAEVKSLWMQQL